jgi:hypothetical protein
VIPYLFSYSDERYEFMSEASHSESMVNCVDSIFPMSTPTLDLS